MKSTDPWAQVKGRRICSGAVCLLCLSAVCPRKTGGILSFAAQVPDIDGQDHYRSLKVKFRASSADIKRVICLSFVSRRTLDYFCLTRTSSFAV